MASAMVNNIVALSPEPFPPTYGWLSPRISFSRDLHHDVPAMAPLPPPAWELSDPDASGKDLADFEFRLDDPVAMLPADELFSDGKLVPLQLATAKPSADAAGEEPSATEIRLPESPKTRRTDAASASDPYLFSPRARRCTTRWRELLGLRRAQSSKTDAQKAATAASSGGAPAAKNPNVRSLKNLLQRNAKTASSAETSLSLPLLRDADSELVSIPSSRLSLSSSSSTSSGIDHEDLPRPSLDSDKPNQSRNQPPRLRLVRPVPVATTEGHHPTAVRGGPSPIRRAAELAPPPPRGVSVDSPRMSSSGKVVYNGLERSSSSPGSFTGGPRPRPRGIERSYSANVRVAPVLNVPVCSLRGSGKSVSPFGLGHFFSPQKKEKDGSAGQTGSSSSVRSGSSKFKIDRRIKPIARDLN